MYVSSDEAGTVPATHATVAFLAGLVSVVGTYWDDSWHTDRGRDDFFIAPHLAIYGGVLVAAVVVGAWARHQRGRIGWRDPARRPLTLAVIAVFMAFASGPIDDVWHRAFGRDAVLWSPPHLLAIMATLALVVGLVAGTATSAPRGVRLLGATLVLGVLLVPVMEYEADVPQFSPAWYLPIVTAALLATRSLVAPVVGGRWALTSVALAYTALRVATAAFLAADGFSTPSVPPVLLVAVLVDAVVTWHPLLRVGVAAVAVHAVYVPWSRIARHATPVLSDELLLSLAATAAAALAVLVVRHESRLRPLATSTLLVALFLFGAMPSAFAHDPGQGTPAGDASMVTRVSGRRVSLAVEPEDCAGLRPVAVVARRAGVTVRAQLDPVQGCGFEGVVDVPRDGRWFVYATFERADRSLEAWLPVEAGHGGETRAVRELYEPPNVEDSGTKSTASAVLLVVSGALALAALSISRRAISRTAISRPAVLRTAVSRPAVSRTDVGRS